MARKQLLYIIILYVFLKNSIDCKQPNLYIKSYFLSYFFAKVDFNECSSDACQNGAICEDLINGFMCRCPPGFSGTHCEIGMYEK